MVAILDAGSGRPGTAAAPSSRWITTCRRPPRWLKSSAVVQGMEMRVCVSWEGKEQGQGIAHLDDGTMIVIENGKDKIGEEAEIVVSSVLQTSAGRMVFAKLR